MLKYEEIINRLENLIENQISMGLFKLPSEAVLCERYHISRQTLRRATAVLEQNGYIKRKKGSGCYVTGLLPSTSRNNIAVILSNDSDYNYTEAMKDITKAFSDSPFTTSIYFTEGKIFKEKNILESLIKNPPRGLLIESIESSFNSSNSKLLSKLSLLGTHIHFIDEGYRNQNFSSIDENYYYLPYYNMFEELVAGGHSQIAMLLPYYRYSGHLAFQAYLDFIGGEPDSLNARVDFDFEDHIMWYSREEFDLLKKEQNLDFIQRFIQTKSKYCSTIICYSDEIAYWLIKIMSKAGISIPESVSVVAMHGSRLGEVSTPSIATLSKTSLSSSSIASENLLETLTGKKSSLINMPASDAMILPRDTFVRY